MIYFKILIETIKNLFYFCKLNKIIFFNSNPDMSSDLLIDYNERFLKHFKLISIYNKNTFSFKRNFFELGPGGSLSNFYTSKKLGFKNYYSYDAIKHNVFGSYANELYNFIKKENNISYNPSTLNYNHTDLIFDESLKFDFFYSWGVMEHVDDLNKMFEFFDKHSDKNSIHLHIIDTHLHGWSNYKNPFKIFEINESTWKMMYSCRYFINRKRKSYYMMLLDKYDFQVLNVNIKNINDFLKSDYPNETLIEENYLKPDGFDQSNFEKNFKDLNDDDLLKKRFILSFKKKNYQSK